jgi:hypothetical protein
VSGCTLYAKELAIHQMVVECSSEALLTRIIGDLLLVEEGQAILRGLLKRLV